jgi:hypothetical protein
MRVCNVVALAIIGVLLFLSSKVHADTIVWNFGDDDAIFDTGTPNHFSVSAFSIGNSFGTVTDPVNSTSASTTYAGASGTGNIGNACRVGPFNATTSAYYQVTLTPDSGYSLNVSDFDFGVRSTGTGPGNYTLYSSIDAFATAGTSIANASITTAGTPWAFKDNTLTSTPTGTSAITLRLYVYNGAGSAVSGQENNRLDDIKISAAATLLPPSTPSPSAIGGGLALFGCIALGRWRFAGHCI